MAGKDRQPTAGLIEALHAAPGLFQCLAAVRILEQQLLRSGGRADSAARGRREAERFRFRAAPSLSYPNEEVTALTPAQTDEEAGIEVGYLGLNGRSGVLPRFYSELVLQQLKLKNAALRDFLDIFNDRAIRHHLAASRKYRLWDAFERTGGSYGDAITAAVRALIGFGTPGMLRDRNDDLRMSVEEPVLLSYAGLFCRQARSAAGLQQMLTDYLCRPVEVIELTGGWVELAAADRSRLASIDRPEGRYARLGVDAVLGSEVLELQGCFRLRLGPLRYEEFCELLPGMPLMDRLADLTHLYVGPALAFEVQLVLARDCVPACALGQDTARLGVNSWLVANTRLLDADDVVLRFDRL
jgi:type VI secretion system protein ImpH